MSFKAKVKKSGKRFHLWEPIDPGLYAAICNPGLTRAKSELFEVSGTEVLCKVCDLHKRGR